MIVCSLSIGATSVKTVKRGEIDQTVIGSWKQDVLQRGQESVNYSNPYIGIFSSLWKHGTKISTEKNLARDMARY